MAMDEEGGGGGRNGGVECYEEKLRWGCGSYRNNEQRCAQGMRHSGAYKAFVK